jgi:predicted branched-subunit amino acid permease
LRLACLADAASLPGFMVKLCIFVGTSVGGLVFGYAGDALGFSFLWSFILSGIGSVVGVYAGWKIAQRYK